MKKLLIHGRFFMKIDNIEVIIKENISDVINDKFKLEEEVNVEIEKPKDIVNGNLSTNIALKLAKPLKSNPMEIASSIVSGLDLSGITVEIKNPGFINFYFDKELYQQIVDEVLSKDEFIFDTNNHAYYNVEYVSANPTGDLHLGHARNAVFGDTICRLLRKTGNKVDAEYYINDAGAQMNNLGLSVQYYYLQNFDIDMEFPIDGYRGQEIKDIASDIVKEFGDSKINEDMEFFREYGYKRNLEEIKRIMKLLNIEFDIWTSERDLHSSNKVENNLKFLEQKGDIFYEDDAMWLATSKYFDDKDRVLKKSDGAYTYFASDVAYHIDKFDRGYSDLIDVWGGDHHGYINRVKSAIASLGYESDKFEVLTIQMINILQNSERVKMSKRKGTSFTIKDLLKEIDADSLRYFFIARSCDTQVDFDIEVAKKQNSDNPIYYIQYAHTRISALLNKAKDMGVEPNLNHKISEFSDLEKEILAYINTYGQMIISASEKRLPHLVCNYLYDLASLYHKYYEQENVLSNKNGQINDKINIAFVIKKILKDGLATIGIEAKDSMQRK